MKFSGPVRTCFNLGIVGSGCFALLDLNGGGVICLGGGLRPGPPPPLGSLSGSGSPRGGLLPLLGVSDIPSSSFTDAAESPWRASSKVWSFWESWECVTCVSGFTVADELPLPEAAPVAISINVGFLGLGCFVGGGVQPSLVRNGVSCSLSMGVLGAGVFPVGYCPGNLGVPVNGKSDRCI